MSQVKNSIFCNSRTVTKSSDSLNVQYHVQMRKKTLSLILLLSGMDDVLPNHSPYIPRIMKVTFYLGVINYISYL